MKTYTIKELFWERQCGQFVAQSILGTFAISKTPDGFTLVLNRFNGNRTVGMTGLLKSCKAYANDWHRKHVENYLTMVFSNE